MNTAKDITAMLRYLQDRVEAARLSRSPAQKKN
jgi:hypothetical protein